MINEIEIPAEVPVMTLKESTLFPQAMMPLYIFEPRYREMLKDVLVSERVFAIAALEENSPYPETEEPLKKIGGVGIVRACRTNPDGTSNLILQGLARVEFTQIVSEEPYRRAIIKGIPSMIDGSEETLQAIKPTILAHTQTLKSLGAQIPDEVIHFLGQVSEPDALLDLSIYTLCTSGQLKQTLLETRSLLTRFEKFQLHLKGQTQQLQLKNNNFGDGSEPTYEQN